MIARKPRSQTEKRIDAINAGADLLGQVNFTVGKAYYGCEEYTLQRGNNRRVIAVSKGADLCTLIDTDPYGTEAESEIAAATAILKGLEQRATVEFTFTNKTDSYYLSAPARFDVEEGVSIDWGDGTTGDTLVGSHQFGSGTFTIKISAPNAKKITNFSIFTGWDNNNDNILYIGGGIEEINNCYATYCKKVVFGDSVKKVLKTAFGDDKLLDFSVPPCVEEFEAPSGNILCNTIYIPETCVKLGSTEGYKRLTNVEICSEGNNLAIEKSSGTFVGLSGTTRGLYAIRNVSLPSRCQLLSTSQQICWNQNVQFFRFERGCTAIPPNFLGSSLSNNARVYIPKTVSSIGSNALKAGTVLFEGTQSEWNAIATNNWNSGVNCTVKYGADFYNAYENDLLRDWGTADIAAGNGIEIDGVSNIMSVALSNDSGLSFENGRLKSNGVTGSDDPALQIINGKIRFRGEASGCFNSKDVSRYTVGDGGSYLQELPSGFKIRSNDTVVALVCENRTGTLPSLFALYITPLYKYSSGAQSYMSGGLWYMGNTTDRVISEIDTSDGNLLFKMTGLVSDYDVTWFVKRNSARYNP